MMNDYQVPKLWLSVRLLSKEPGSNIMKHKQTKAEAEK